MSVRYEGNLQELLRRTAETIAAQPALPLSPGTMDGDRPQLCAAAALVHQAAALASPKSDLVQLAESMVAKGREYILGIAADVGLNTSFVDEIMKKNDSCSPSERRDKMIGYFEGSVATVRS
jgi:hypothetical protein